jgi:hypothetical protein
MLMLTPTPSLTPMLTCCPPRPLLEHAAAWTGLEATTLLVLGLVQQTAQRRTRCRHCGGDDVQVTP